MTKNYMAIDQYGHTHHNLGPHPRKGLLAKLGRKHAARIYQDTKDGSPVHVGWIIAGLWLSVFEVIPMCKPA